MQSRDQKTTLALLEKNMDMGILNPAFYLNNLGCLIQSSAVSLDDLIELNRKKSFFPEETMSSCAQIAAYCFVKALQYQPNDTHWCNLGNAFRDGAIISDVLIAIDEKKILPDNASQRQPAQLVAYCYAKSLFQNAKNHVRWNVLGHKFYQGADLGDLPVEMMEYFGAHVRKDAPANLYCALFCFERSLANANDEKMINHLILTINHAKERLRKAIYLNIASQAIKFPSDVNKENETAPLLKNKKSPTKKRKAMDSADSNKKFKSDNKLLSTSSTFFQPEKRGPILHFDMDEVLEVIAILRRGNNCQDNCTHLAKDLLEYFKTGRMPVKPTSTIASSTEDFSVTLGLDYIERKNKSSYEGPVYSKIKRNESSFPDLPYDVKNSDVPIINVDKFTQPSASIDKINDRLMQQASENEQGVSFGMINIGRCGSHVEKAGHMLVYFATRDAVWYIDCQKYDGIKNEDKGCIVNDLSQCFRFASKNRIDINTFGDNVFYTPIGPKSTPLQEVVVKQECTI